MPKDISAGVRWLQRAADQGEAGALYNLGTCYYNGEGVPKDFDKALALLKRAADGGHEGAAQAIRQLKAALAR
jgi:TPR repeat protein